MKEEFHKILFIWSQVFLLFRMDTKTLTEAVETLPR